MSTSVVTLTPRQRSAVDRAVRFAVARRHTPDQCPFRGAGAVAEAMRVAWLRAVLAARPPAPGMVSYEGESSR